MDDETPPLKPPTARAKQASKRAAKVQRDTSHSPLMKIVTAIAALGCLGLGALVVLRPNVVYTPVARVTLYMLVTLLPATLLTTVAATRVTIEWPGFVARAGGTAAVFFIAFVLMNRFSAPDLRLAVFRVRGESADISLEGGLGQTKIIGAPVRYCVDGDQLFVEFPEQVEQATLVVRYPPSERGQTYEGTIGYAGIRNYTLKLGKDLVKQ